MAKDSFLLVSLKEDQAKKLAQIVTNDTSRQILNFLSDKKDSTESEIAKKLNLPISTVHYNLQRLVHGKLIEIEGFHYSKKGKEVNHYKLANKFIIIAPKSTFGFKEKLRSILPAGILAIASTAAIQFFYKSPLMKATPMLKSEMLEAAPRAAIETISEPNIALWFLFGAVLTIGFYFIFEYVKYLKEKR